MTIKWRIRPLMKEKQDRTGVKETYRKIYDETGISPNTLTKMATGRSKHVGVTTIERLLQYFECAPNDLIHINGNS